MVYKIKTTLVGVLTPLLKIKFLGKLLLNRIFITKTNTMGGTERNANYEIGGLFHTIATLIAGTTNKRVKKVYIIDENSSN